uniref:Uncharacterized protein n=1 Tax=Plectus sambesii TaxID=2011161 RepID=A0A914VXA3_9BILA
MFVKITVIWSSLLLIVVGTTASRERLIENERIIVRDGPQIPHAVFGTQEENEAPKTALRAAVQVFINKDRSSSLRPFRSRGNGGDGEASFDAPLTAPRARPLRHQVGNLGATYPVATPPAYSLTSDYEKFAEYTSDVHDGATGGKTEADAPRRIDAEVEPFDDEKFGS